MARVRALGSVAGSLLVCAGLGSCSVDNGDSTSYEASGGAAASSASGAAGVTAAGAGGSSGPVAGGTAGAGAATGPGGASGTAPSGGASSGGASGYAGVPTAGAGSGGTTMGGTAGTGGTGTGATGGTPSGGTSGSGSQEGDPCGWNDQGRILWVGSDVELCLPPTICNLEVCQADLGTCVPDGLDGECVHSPGYDGLRTLPEAWATWYCDLETGCLGTLEAATHDVRDQVQQNLQLPFCYEDTSTTCLGIVAVSPMLGGNSRLARDASGSYLREWGLGLTPASGLCYEIEGMTGNTAVVAVTDRCAGYCACDPGRTAFEECGNCMLAGANDPADVTPSCPCVGNIASMGAEGQACPGERTCDWCMSNSHPHFDLDVDTFNHVCADQAVQGSCRLARVSIVDCMDPLPWPCEPGSWFCFEQNASGRIPGTYCCQ